MNEEGGGGESYRYRKKKKKKKKNFYHVVKSYMYSNHEINYIQKKKKDPATLVKTRSYVHVNSKWIDLIDCKRKRNIEKKEWKKKTPKQQQQQHNHRLNNTTEVITIPANAPTTPTTPHLV